MGLLLALLSPTREREAAAGPSCTGRKPPPVPSMDLFAQRHYSSTIVYSYVRERSRPPVPTVKDAPRQDEDRRRRRMSDEKPCDFWIYTPRAPGNKRGKTQFARAGGEPLARDSRGRRRISRWQLFSNCTNMGVGGQGIASCQG
jgi:hypothetical protein